MKNIGIMGGTFDPPHIAHVKCVEFVLKKFPLDSIIVVPNGNPPHKEAVNVDKIHRFNMVKIAFKNPNQIFVSDMEIKNSNPCYSYLTLREIKSQFCNENIFFIIGIDNLKTIHLWKEYKTLIYENDFICMDRGGINTVQFRNTNLNQSEFDKLTKNIIHTPLMKISSTEIRQLLKMDKNNPEILNYLDKEILTYIVNNGLY